MVVYNMQVYNFLKFYMKQAISSLKDFQILSKLGDGAFAQVYKVKRKEDNCVYAMKKITMTKIKQKDRNNALNQVRILASDKMQHIIEFKQAFYDEPTSCLCIVMQYASGGDLLKLIQAHIKNRTKIPEKQIWKALVQISKGLKSLHDKKIVHRDLKGANIFITGDSTYKLGDLNVSKVIKDDLARTQTGTPYYASPQIWKDQPYGTKSDIWSLGCVIYEMAAQRPPFTAQDIQSLYKKICNGYFPRIPFEYSNDLWHVICSLLKANHHDRPSAGEIIYHDTVQSYFSTSSQENDYLSNPQLLSTIFLHNDKNLKSINAVLPKSQYNKNIMVQHTEEDCLTEKTIVDSFFKQSQNIQNTTAKSKTKSFKIHRSKIKSCFQDQTTHACVISRERVSSINPIRKTQDKSSIENIQIFKNLATNNIIAKKLQQIKHQTKESKIKHYSLIGDKLPPLSLQRNKYEQNSCKQQSLTQNRVHLKAAVGRLGDEVIKSRLVKKDTHYIR